MITILIIIAYIFLASIAGVLLDRWFESWNKKNNTNMDDGDFGFIVAGALLWPATIVITSGFYIGKIIVDKFTGE